MPTDSSALPSELTVALPTCNGARHLREALGSILAQGEDYHLIVSDDRSDDDTLAIVREVAGDRARISVNAERLGLAGNWNRCVALARTPLVAIFHQDDLMRPGHLAAHRAAFADDPRIGLVASAAGVVDAEGRVVSPSVVGRGGLGDRDLLFSPGEAVRVMAVENPLRCSAVTLRSSAHEEAGGFRSDYRYVVDWDFWLRVSQTWSVKYLATVTVDVRWHAGSETHRFATSMVDLEETARLVNEFFTQDGLALPDPRSLRRAADRRLSRAYLNRAHVLLRKGSPELARLALGRSLRLWPGIMGWIALDPRLAAQMAALIVSPGWASRLFRRNS